MSKKVNALERIDKLILDLGILESLLMRDVDLDDYNDYLDSDMYEAKDYLESVKHSILNIVDFKEGL
jgi:hypothetical protein